MWKAFKRVRHAGGRKFARWCDNRSSESVFFEYCWIHTRREMRHLAGHAPSLWSCFFCHLVKFPLVWGAISNSVDCWCVCFVWEERKKAVSPCSLSNNQSHLSFCLLHWLQTSVWFVVHQVILKNDFEKSTFTNLASTLTSAIFLHFCPIWWSMTITQNEPHCSSWQQSFCWPARTSKHCKHALQVCWWNVNDSTNDDISDGKEI